MRCLGHTNVGDIDDSLLTGDIKEECQSNISDTIQVFQRLGFVVHSEKSVLVPVQTVTFLGCVLNSVNMTVSLTEARKVKIIDACQELLSLAKKVSIRKVARVLGLLVSTSLQFSTRSCFTIFWKWIK